jgi:type VI secretion system protein ImpJ
MSKGGMIHWHEGLFLQPHHLQLAAREQAQALSRERRLHLEYPYGVLECRVASDGLENNLVRLDKLRAVLPSGLEVDVPGNADIPALDIKRTLANNPSGFTVSVAVPVWQSTRANTIEAIGGGDVRVKRIYKVEEAAVGDENTGENSQPVLVRRINARLVVDGDDTTDMEVLPLLRIMASAEQATLPRPDTRYIPPCLTIAGSPTLKNMLRDLANAVEAARNELVSQLTRGGFVLENLKPPQMLMLMRLQILNRYAASLPTLFAGGAGAAAGAGHITPFGAYLQLRSLQGELAALTPDRDPYEGPKYDHDRPEVVFGELDKKIRPLLRSETRGRFVQIPFIKTDNVLMASLTEEQQKQATGYWIGIKTRMDAGVLATLVENQDKFKLMPKSLVRLHVFGVKLKEDRHPPMELPSASDLHYFRVVQAESASMWEKVTAERSMAIRWTELEQFEYTDVSLYMTIP